MVSLNLDILEGQELVSMLECKVVLLPIISLGVPLHWKKLHENKWIILIEKVEKR